MNQNQKIRYVLKIKEENNSLRKQLTKMCNELRKATESHPDDQTKELRQLNNKLKRYKEELVKVSADSKKHMKAVSKICDYVLSRPVFPDSYREQNRDAAKIKVAIEGITYMTR